MRLNPILSTLMVAVPLSPFAAFAAWRTWVHARKKRELGTSGLQGVFEAGLLGFLVVGLPMVGLVFNSGRHNPREAAGYVAVYAGLGLVVGLACGVILWFTATLVLAFSSSGNRDG